MTTWALVAFLVKFLVAYLVVGGLIVIGTAFVNALLGGNWFSEKRKDRWESNTDFPNPAIVFWVWPIVIMVGAIVFVGIGIKKAIEAAGNKARAIGEKREKQLRGETNK